MKKFTHYFNLLSVITCLIFAIVFHDKVLIGYLFLGLFQIILLIVITIKFIIYKKYIKSIMIYWTLVLTYFFIIQRIFNHYNCEELGLLSVPIMIAFYNCYITFLNTKIK